DLFTDVLRHDLLNSVSVIHSSVDLLEDVVEDQEIIDVIENQTNKLEDTIEKASTLAHVESFEKLDLVGSDLSEYVKDAMEEMKTLAQKKGIVLKGEFEGRYPVKCNPIFKEVPINLISNAIKYGPTDSKISIGIEDDGDGWRIMVKDNGQGIPDEYKKDIFHRFIRKEKGGTKGTGLGLAIVQGIVALHKGSVWVEDNKPRGSIFYVKVPKEQ
ncbi:MAG: sensor histidine kinase, partial [Candidatus Hydrothermarchaeales archaeon]